MVVMKLPYPLSANRYWRSFVPRGASRAITTVSEEARAFKEDIGWRIKAYGITTPLTCRVSIHVAIYPARPLDWAKRVKGDPLTWDDTVRCIDLDNARKVLYDAFTGVLFTDDSRVFRDSAERMEPDGEARAIVTVTPYVRELDPQGALA